MNIATNFGGQAYVTDLDGTLLRGDASLSEYTARTLTAALESGVVVTFATARSYISASRFVSRIPWTYPVIIYNGAMLLDPVTGAVLAGCWLEAEAANLIVDKGSQLGLKPFLFALEPDDRERVLHEPLTEDCDIRFRQSRPGDPRFMEVERLSCMPEQRVIGITYIGKEERLLPLYEQVKAGTAGSVHVHMVPDTYLTGYHFLEISHPMANKREALRLWANRMNIDCSRITAFGDNMNDLGLFEAAGTAVAVGNAQEALKRHAGLIIGSNEEDAVASYIDRAIRTREQSR